MDKHYMMSPKYTHVHSGEGLELFLTEGNSATTDRVVYFGLAKHVHKLLCKVKSKLGKKLLRRLLNLVLKVQRLRSKHNISRILK
jgi:hypothetical protein